MTGLTRLLRQAQAARSAFVTRWRAVRAGARVPPIGEVDFGDLRRLQPVSRQWGLDRGRPVDRHYIEAFLQANARDIRGRVLEAGDSTYTRRYGHDRVEQADVLHVSADAPGATIVADLGQADHVASDLFDCIILTQTLHLIYDVAGAMGTLHRILRPDGVLLLTVPGITQTTDETWRDSWFWSFTQVSLERVTREAFGDATYRIGCHGNVLAATCFLQGIAADELTARELAALDTDFPVTLTLRAHKPGPPAA